MSKTTKKRSEIDSKFQWNLEAMFKDDASWEDAVSVSLKEAENFVSYKGRIAENADTLLEVLTKRDFIWQTIERVYVYARMRRDEDNTVEKYQSMCDKSETAISKISVQFDYF